MKYNQNPTTMKNSLFIFLTLFITVFIMNCTPFIELTVLQRPGQEDREDREAYCYRQGDALIVRISNVGTQDAPASKLEVEFPGYPTYTVITSPIPAGGTIEVPVTIPSGCFDSDCEFRITVDADNVKLF